MKLSKEFEEFKLKHMYNVVFNYLFNQVNKELNKNFICNIPNCVLVPNIDMLVLEEMKKIISSGNFQKVYEEAYYYSN